MNTSIQTKLRKKLSLARARKGFSLVELLVVIAVIGIIAAIAIPNIAGITGSANVARDQRNGQSIASVAAAAQAAGWSPSGSEDTDVTLLTSSTGATVGAGSNIMTFKVPNMSSTDVTGAKKYLKSNLEYDPTGGS